MTPETRDEMTDFSAGFAQALPRVDHEISAAALFPVAHLSRKDGKEFFAAHAPPRQHAAALHMRGRGYDDGGVNMGMTAAFEKKRNIERDHGDTVLPCLFQKRLLRLPHHGMHDRLESAARIRVAEHRGTKFCAVNAVRSGRTRKCCFDRRERRTAGALQPVDFGIGIEHRHARAPQHRRDGRLAHADRAGETEDDHCASSALSSSSQPSGGGAPKNSEKAIAAWPISISSPSTVSRP